MKNPRSTEHTISISAVKRFYREPGYESEYATMKKEYMSKIEHIRKILGTAQGTLDEVRNAGSLNWQQLKHKL